MVKLPKKVVIIASGVVVLTGASGATAFFIGKDKILGPSAQELGGVECTDVIRVADMRKDRAPWLRKYVRVPPGTDGMTRVKTALRVAKKVQETLPADLIEIAVLDQSGPDKRAAMRGRAIGAEVIVVRDTAKVPGITEPITIQYYQGAASGTGMFYGEEATISSEEAEELLSKMKELTDCAPPPGKEEAGDKKHEKKKEKKPEKKPEKKKEGEGHEAAAKEGEGHEAGAKEGEGGHEAAKAEEPKKEEKPEVVFPNDIFGRMQKAAFDKAEEAAAAEEEAKKEHEAKEPGMFGKMLGAVGLGSKEEPEGEHGASSEGGEHAAPSEEGGTDHGALPEESGGEHAPAKVKPIAGHESRSEPKADAKSQADHGGDAAQKPDAGKHEKAKSETTKSKPEKSGHEASAQPEEKSGGFMSKMLGMVGLGGDKPKDTIEHSGGPAIVSGKKVVKDEAGHEEAKPPADHDEAKPSDHGDASASEHGAEATDNAPKPNVEQGAAADHERARTEAEHPVAEPKKDDHAPAAHGG